MSRHNGDKVACYYCGHTLNAATLGRLDQCAQCGKYLHACRMCKHYDPAETSKQCVEDDAEKVQDKQAANFCDYFSLSGRAFDAGAITADEQARTQLAALFDDSDAAQTERQASETPGMLKDAEALFRKQ